MMQQSQSESKLAVHVSKVSVFGVPKIGAWHAEFDDSACDDFQHGTRC